MIVLTSNIGITGTDADAGPGIRKTRDDGDKQAKYGRMKKKVLDEVRKIFKPEFVNRLDEIIVFQPLDMEEITKIVDLFLGKVNKEVMAQERMMKATLAAKHKLAKEGYDPQYGARPLRRAIQRLVEDPLAEEFIRGNVPEGATILVDYIEGEENLTFRIFKAGEEIPDLDAEREKAEKKEEEAGAAS